MRFLNVKENESTLQVFSPTTWEIKKTKKNKSKLMTAWLKNGQMSEIETKNLKNQLDEVQAKNVQQYLAGGTISI